MNECNIINIKYKPKYKNVELTMNPHKSPFSIRAKNIKLLLTYRIFNFQISLGSESVVFATQITNRSVYTGTIQKTS